METTDTCYRSGSKWYVDLMCDRKDGSWLPMRNWAPLVFYILMFLISMFLILISEDIYSDIQKGGEILFSLFTFILISTIIAMLILQGQIFWAWFIALLPYIFCILFIIIGIIIYVIGGSCSHCTGKCTKFDTNV